MTGEDIDRSLAANNIKPDGTKRTKGSQVIALSALACDVASFISGGSKVSCRVVSGAAGG